MNLLMVDDDSMYCEYVIARLDDLFHVDVAHTLSEGLAMLDAGDYGAVLLDVGLPDALRSTVVSQVKAVARGVAVVVLSGYEMPEYIRDTIRESAADYLVKGRDDNNGPAMADRIRAAVVRNATCLLLDSEIRRMQNMEAAA